MSKTLEGFIKEYTEEGVVGIIEAYRHAADVRREYAKSPQARMASAKRRIKMAEELKEFRAFKATKVGVKK